MSRKSPVELHRIALHMHRNGHSPSWITETLGLHPGSLSNWLTQQDTAQHWAGTRLHPRPVQR